MTWVNIESRFRLQCYACRTIQPHRDDADE